MSSSASTVQMTAAAHSGHWQPEPAKTWVPTAPHRLLLTVLLADAPNAIAAWQQWVQQTDIENLDEGSYWLLPRIYLRLQHLEITQPTSIINRIKGVYRHVWSRNQMVLRNLGNAIATLQTANIPAIALNGAALVSIAGADIGSRRVDDSGIWVPAERLGDAIAQLQRMGWQPTQTKPSTQLRWQQTTVGMKRGKDTFTLYWQVLPGCPNLSLMEQTPTLTAALGQVDVPILTPTALCLLCCVNATRWQPRSPVYWLADAAWLIHHQQIDWQQLRTLAQTHQLTLALQKSLTQLEGLLTDQGFTTTLAALQDYVPTRFEQSEFWAHAAPHPRLGHLPVHWFAYRRLHSQTGPSQLPEFAQFLAQRWGLQQSRQLPWHIGRQVLKRWHRRSART